MKVELCPECGSGKINRIDPLSGGVRCDACNWAGKEENLIATSVGASTADVAMSVAQLFLVKVTQEASMPLGRAMIHAGLITSSTDPKTVARIVKAAVLGAHKATLIEIDNLQKELGSDNKS